MGAYTLVGESIFNQHASKYVQMACFYDQSTLRLRFFDHTADAYERCLNEEFQMKHFLCDQPKQFILHDYQDQICINVDFELSTVSRMNIGYKEIPLAAFWTNQIHRSSLLFLIPNHDDAGKIVLNQFNLHVNVYQPMILESALHTCLSINTRHVSLRHCSILIYISALLAAV